MTDHSVDVLAIGPHPDDAELMCGGTLARCADQGYRTAILSGGFTWFARRLQERLGIDYVFANELDIKDGMVTGEVVGDIVDGEMKADLLKRLAEQENIALEQTIAVGDGANDLPMISIAGLGVAFNAKPVVRQKAANAISSVGLDGLLYLIGIHDREIRISRT